MTHPEIRINLAELLYEFASQEFSKNMKEDLPSYDDCYQWTENYRVEWAKHEQKILSAMTGVLGITFYKSTIDVSLAPFFIPQSDPVIINFANQPDQFVDVLTHELIHVLLTDNNKVQIRNVKPALNLYKEWVQLFGIEDFSTVVHVPVHAVLKYLYLDVLKDPKRLERDISGAKVLWNGQAYVDAWSYVNSNDYKKIIDLLSASYSKVPAS